MLFVKKSTVVSYFYLKQRKRGNTFLDILDRKERFLELKSEVLKQSKISKFSKGISPWLLSKNLPFFHISFFYQREPEKKTFFDILERKECFLDLKSEVLKKSKNRHFAKGLVMVVVKKSMDLLYVYFVQRKGKRNIF